LEVVRALWAGNVHHENRIAYSGQNNDRDPILQKVSGIIPTATSTSRGLGISMIVRRDSAVFRCVRRVAAL
jgi:hypothetical protein